MPLFQSKPENSQSGFTIIELITAITILGILSIMVIPRFFNLSTDSRTAVVKALGATVEEASMTAAAQCSYTPGCFGNGVTWLLTIGTGHYQMWNGYLDAGDTIGNNEIDTLITISNQFSVSIVSPTMTIWQYTNSPNPATCAVEYTEASSTTSPPTITVLTSGC